MTLCSFHIYILILGRAGTEAEKAGREDLPHHHRRQRVRVLQEAAPLRPPRGQDGGGQQQQEQDDALPDGELPRRVHGGLGRRCLTGEIMDQPA